MIQIKKTILTLVALLAVTAGAWAQEEYESFDLSSANTNVNGTHFTITGTSGMNSYGLFLSGESVTVTSLNGENITRVEFIIGLGKSKAENITGTPGTNSCTNGNENGSITDINATSVTLSTENTGTTSVSIKQITVYYAYAPAASGPEVAWDKAAKTGTFTQPAGNVTLEPEYYPQATLTAAPTPSTSAKATTDDLLVSGGTVANIGETTTAQGTVMYYVSLTNMSTEALLALDADKWVAEPTAAGIPQKCVAYVYYYVKGNNSTDDALNFSDGDITSDNLITVDVLPAPTYSVTFADDLAEPTLWTASPNADVTKGQTVTVSYSGSKKVLGVKAEKKAAAVMTTVTWNSTNVFNSAHENVELSGWYPTPLSYEGITISFSGTNASSFQAYDEDDHIGSLLCYGNNGDSFTFTAPSGKKFCKIEIINNGFIVFTNYGDWTKDASNKIVWSGTAATAVTLGSVYTTADNLNSIVFYLSE